VCELPDAGSHLDTIVSAVPLPKERAMSAERAIVLVILVVLALILITRFL
jgi:hypothetical protein